MLYHTALSLQHTDFTNDNEASDAIAKVKEVIYLFGGHADLEDSMVFPLLNESAPQLVAEFEQQHVRDHELSQELEQALEGLRTTQPAIEKIKAGLRLQWVFAEFTAFNLSHMNQEETIVKEELWKHFSDQELLAVTHRIVATTPAEKNAGYSFWMLKGLAMNEIIGWFKGMKAEVSSFVFEQMMALAATALSAAKYQLLQNAVEENAVA